MASAQRGDQRLIAVVMGDSSENQRAVDAGALLNWGFRFYETHRLYDAGKQVAVQRVWKGSIDNVRLGVSQPLLVSSPRGQYERMKATMDIPKTLVAPIAKGQALGTVKVALDGKVIAQAPLVALDEVPQGGFFSRLWDSLLMWWHSL